ncbi:S9 family peptidase [Ferruginibacter albus]|uniref:S9 family peptidase n=1 Tax=Ferruginibacter albus TaxID=2875540 RepID=UPI001CC6A262|nr:alpha/beta fold hydrolase [Ferruginibacter albus]UAY50864.1 alpha/beta fold hydrolase [Ferruginibacter albus]
MNYKMLFTIAIIFITSTAVAQNLTPELLWQLGRVGGVGISKDGKSVLYNVTTPDIANNSFDTKTYSIPLNGGTPVIVTNVDSIIGNDKISPDGKYTISDKAVKLKKVYGSDYYPDLSKSNVQIYDNLMYRHWDTWEDGKFNHVFLSLKDSSKDLMFDEPYDCPTKPHGTPNDYVWSTDGKQVVYVCKKKFGTDYTLSTNTDLYAYNIETGKTTDLTEDNKGYDISPSFNKNGDLAWLSMKRDGYESDKQDLVVSNGITKQNLTKQNDLISIGSYRWSNDNKNLFFLSAVNGTEQLYSVSYPGLTKMMPVIKQITSGDFDIAGIVGQADNALIVSRTDMNHAPELYTVDISNGSMKQLTHVNDSAYATIGMSKIERRFVKTTDNKDMLVWVIYPPGFDKTKKYPTLLYCQGGPQSPLTQFYSFRWNFQLMAANGYIIVAPDRRGMAGFGTKWNEQISKDWGGQVMNDYLSAIDAMKKEAFVDTTRLGCVGASYGGYSVYYLAGIHNHRFKTFIAHDGVFDTKSMYGTTDEMFFENWEHGGPYWDKTNADAQKSITVFNPSNFVSKWDAPILIIEGGHDYRVPLEQAQQAFQAAQLRGIKSKLLYFPEENHWVTSPQNALVWQHEFFNWLKETL